MPGDPNQFTDDELHALLEKRRDEAAATAAAEALKSMQPTQITVRGSTADLPNVDVSADPYAANIWGSKEFDFTTPSGQLCRMKRVSEIELLQSGILDKVSRLPGLAQSLVDKSEGKPPEPELDMAELADNVDKLQDLLDVINKVCLSVVVRPKLAAPPMPDPETGEVKARMEGVIYVDDVEMGDRVAIMERAMRGLRSMDSFRPGS